MGDQIIKNALIVTPDALLAEGWLLIRNGIIESLAENNVPVVAPGVPTMDAGGKMLIPGIIDIHTDAIEKEIHPRPGANFPINVAFRELERRMSGCGITTVYHSLYLGYYAAEENDNMPRKQLFETIGNLCRSNTIIDNRIHLRFEVTGIKEYKTCIELIKQGYVHLLSFMDHTPGQGQYGLEKYIQYLRTQGISEKEIEQHCQESLRQPRLTKEQMLEISDLCRKNGIPIASHDDDHAEKVSQMHSLGATICEFPINEVAARKGVELNMPTVGGASNVLRGGSLNGNLHIQQAIEAKLINTLCSDYYPPAILHSIFKLYQDNSLTLPEAVKLGTLNPAKAGGLADCKGSIEPGKDADIILVDLEEGVPLVTHTFLKGNLVAQANFYNKQANR